MLLASALPFYGKDRMQIIKKILKNKYSFKGKCWKRVSPEAKSFISNLLVLDPDQRADAERALGSAWLKATLTSTTTGTPRAEEEEMARSSMLNYAVYPKLKKMALMVVAHKSSSEEIGILRKLFEKYDSRHDGSIWFEEFCEAMSGSGHSNKDLRSIYDAMVSSRADGASSVWIVAIGLLNTHSFALESMHRS
jgi:calcium-dependent protein kinase